MKYSILKSGSWSSVIGALFFGLTGVTCVLMLRFYPEMYVPVPCQLPTLPNLEPFMAMPQQRSIARIM